MCQYFQAFLKSKDICKSSHIWGKREGIQSSLVLTTILSDTELVVYASGGMYPAERVLTTV